jgi:hypothetical protein
MKITRRTFWSAILVGVGVLALLAFGAHIGRDLALRDNAAHAAP